MYKTFPALLGRKIGMMRIFDNNENSAPVTVIEAGPCVISQVKTLETDGYNAIQLGFGYSKNFATKPLTGHFKSAGSEPKRFIREIRFEKQPELKRGDVLNVDIFKDVNKVDITGITKGRGFTGMVKRWNKKRGPESHGSMNVRQVGSIASSPRLTRVWPGKHMPGHYGVEKVTVRNLKIEKIDSAKNLLFVKGAVPGPKNGYLVICKTKKIKRAIKIEPVKAKVEAKKKAVPTKTEKKK